jgi:hypothetical protein
MRRWPAPRRFDSPMIGRPRRQSKALLAPQGGFAALCIAGLVLVGCHRNAADAQNAAGDAASDQPASSLETGYVKPPALKAAERQSGGVLLSGSADPDARVRLSSPDGVAYGATATAAGAWSIVAPAETTVRLFGLSEVLGSRSVQGLGYFAVLPAPGRPAVRLRAGGGSEAVSEAEAAPQLTTVDFDSGGGAVVSGLAKPGAPVRVSIDGGAPAEARPDARGWFSVALPGVLKPGDHQAIAQSSGGSRQAVFSISPAAPLGGASYRGQRQAGAWRIDWLTPGGAAQTTLALDASETAARP